MARRDNNLAPTPRPLTQGLQLVAALISQSRGQKVSQREITGALETALEARQRRIIVSRSQVNLVKRSCVLVQALCIGCDWQSLVGYYGARDHKNEEPAAMPEMVNVCRQAGA